MKPHAPRFIELAETAKQRIKELTITDAQQAIAAGQLTWVIDVRELAEWQQGHLPGAIHLSKGVLERDIEQIVTDPQASILLYCSGGYRSALAADNLQRMGYQQVYSLQGGSSAWVAAGFSWQK